LGSRSFNLFARFSKNIDLDDRVDESKAAHGTYALSL
jgi:hypothetical protein